MNSSGSDLEPSRRGTSTHPDEAQPTASVASRAKRSIRWVFWGRLGLQIVSIGFTVVLARTLTPADFGLYGLAFVILQFVVQVESLRIEAALVQVDQLDQRLFSAAWVLSVTLSLVSAFALVVAANPLAAFFGSPDLASVLSVGSSVFVVRALFMPARVVMKRTLRFGEMTVVEIVRIVPSGLVAVWMAFTGYGAWSLLAFYLLRELLGGLLLFWIVRSSLPAFRMVRGSGLVPRLRFGAASSASELLVHLLYSVPDLFVGRFIGASPLGMFRQGVALVGRPVAYIDDVMNKVAFPVLSRAWGDRELVRRGYVQAVRLMFAFALPILAITAVLADEFVILLYGSQWAAAVPVVQILAAVGVARMVQPLASSVFHAADKPRVEACINGGVVALLLVLLLSFRPTTIADVASIVAGAYAALALVGLFFSGRMAGVALSDIARAVYAPVAAIGIAVICALFVRSLVESTLLPARVGAVTIVLALVYSLILFQFDRQILSDVRRLAFGSRFGKGSGVSPGDRENVDRANFDRATVDRAHGEDVNAR